MVHRAEQQGDVIGFASEHGKIQRVALRDRNGFAGQRMFPEDLNVVGHQLKGIHLPAMLRQCVAVAACASANFHDAHTGLQILPDVMHRGQKFDGTVPGIQTAVLVVIIIKFD